MGLKMPLAFYSSENRIISVDEARERSIKNCLECSNSNCRVSIIYVEPTKRNYSDGKMSLVRDHFRLKVNRKHAEDCEYNTSGQVKIIARNSDGILESIGKEKYDFRLNVVAESLKKEKQGIKKADSAEMLVNGKPSSVSYTNKGKIDSYLSTMKKIMVLRNKLEDHKEMRSLVNVKVSGEKIPWSKFYFDQDNYRKCFEYVNTQNIYHPVCIEGKIKELRLPDKFPFYSVKLLTPLVKENDKDGINRRPTVSFVVKDQSVWKFIQDELANGKENIAFYSYIKTKSNPFKGAEYLNIQGEIYNKQQIYLY